MSNLTTPPERTGKRDLAFSRFHRHCLSPRCGMIDGDVIEYCRICNRVLFLAETTFDTGETKYATILRELASNYRHGVPCYTIYYRTKGVDEDGVRLIVSVRMRRTYPNPTPAKSMLAEELAMWFECQHDLHERECDARR